MRILKSGSVHVSFSGEHPYHVSAFKRLLLEVGSRYFLPEFSAYDLIGKPVPSISYHPSYSVSLAGSAKNEDDHQEHSMKISHFLLLWSATLGLALPTSTPRKPVGNSNQNDQGLSKDELLEVARISAAYLTGIGLAGAGAWAYHRHTVKQLLEEQEEARRQSQQQLDGIIRSRERMTGRLVNAAFDRGTEAERNHRRLVRCFEEQVRI